MIRQNPMRLWGLGAISRKDLSRGSRSSQRGGSVSLSDEMQDKPHACLNQSWAESDYLAEKPYYDACLAWWDTLTAVQQALGFAVMQLFSVEHPQNAENAAAALPAAPVCPAGLRGQG